MRTYIAAVLAAGLLSAACGGGAASDSKKTSSAPTSAGTSGYVVVGAWNGDKTSGPKLKAQSCTLKPSRPVDGKYAQPDPRCTPGATTADITDLNTKTTVCSSTYLATLKPDPKVLATASADVLAAYGLTAKKAAYDVQFLIPLRLGGAFDERNMWPVEKGTPTSRYKATVDRKLAQSLCGGTGGVKSAQSLLAARWPSVLKELGIR
jgi:hypothetical protein